MPDATVTQKAAEFLRAGSPAQALAVFRTTLEPGKPDFSVYRALADELYRQGSPDDAIIAYELALAMRPTILPVLYNAAMAYKARGDYLDAERLLKRAEQEKSDSPHVQKMLGEVYFHLGRFDEAIAYYDAALAAGPDRQLRYRRERAVFARDGKLDDPATVFAAIYAHDAWGNTVNRPHRFFSGEGSHAPQTVQTYVSAVTGFLRSLGGKPDVADIGCGDFNIGSKIRPACDRYVALDVVADLVAYNAERFAGLDVEFAQLDVTRDQPPVADVYFIREVFQHLSNAQIAKALANIEGRFKHLVFTEAVPKTQFTPNLDKHSGEQARVYVNMSGVVLTEAPFNARFAREAVLCTVERQDSLVVTRVYSVA